jgi:4-hydroxy-3-methylbut-2-en-1-yl diphosphate reductase
MDGLTETIKFPLPKGLKSEDGDAAPLQHLR